MQLNLHTINRTYLQHSNNIHYQINYVLCVKFTKKEEELIKWLSKQYKPYTSSSAQVYNNFKYILLSTDIR